MLKNHKLASAIADCGFYEFKRQLTYKCEWYGSELVIADRFYPSSQICSNCGNQQKMPLNVRTYVSAALRSANVLITSKKYLIFVSRTGAVRYGRH
ncbi:MAG: transposase [Okeania sp. SIO3B3]|nr:transposase [Okeania sp. SIO3B3]